MTLLARITFPLKWLFDIPPVEQRPEIRSFMRHFIYIDYNRQHVESYLFYKVFVVNLVINCFFMLAFYWSFRLQRSIDLGIFEIVYRADAATNEFVYGYPAKVFPILMWVTVVYSLALFLSKTDFLSRTRILSEPVPVTHRNKQLYKHTPIFWIAVLAFCILTGRLMYAGPEFLGAYELYNYVHDFRAHTITNLHVFMAIYWIAYQTFFCQMFVYGSVLLTRSLLSMFFYRL